MPETENVIEAQHAAGPEISAADLEHEAWQSARPARLTRYWSGEEAPAGRHAEARIVWTAEALCVRFVCRQSEPLVISDAPQTAAKTIGLWERDVCEIFIAPDARAPERYFEFEAAPTGEWLDLGIQQLAGERLTDWEFRSGMRTAASVSTDSIMIAMRIPWDALGRQPRAGDEWRTNLFRCIGLGPQRGYLAWQPTLTARPNFHVPQAFGKLKFKADSV